MPLVPPNRPFRPADHPLWLAWMGIVLIAGPIACSLAFGPCTAIIVAVPLAALTAAWTYAGVQMQMNRVGPLKYGLIWPLAESYNSEGQRWLVRAKVLLINFLLGGVLLAGIASRLCSDYPH
jgi:hypothetical protein